MSGNKINMANSGNVGIISLMASLESNSKEIAKSLNKDVQKISENVKDIDIKIGTANIQSELHEIKTLIDKELKGLDTSKYFQSIVKVFSDSTKSSTDYLSVLREVRKELDIINTATKDQRRRSDIAILGDLSPDSFKKVIAYYQEISKQRQALEQAQKNERAKALDLKGRGVSRIKASYSSNENYNSVSEATALVGRAKDLDIMSKIKDASLKPVLVDYNQLVYIFDDLIKKKDDLLKSPKTKTNAETLVKTYKEIADVFAQIETVEGQLKSKYGAKEGAFASIGLRQSGEIDHISQKISEAARNYADIATSSMSKAVLQIEEKLTEIFAKASTRARENIDKQYTKVQSSNQKKAEAINAKLNSLPAKDKKTIAGSVVSESDVQSIQQYLVDLDKCVDKIFELDSIIEDDNIDPQKRAEAAKEQLLYFAQANKLSGENTEGLIAELGEDTYLRLSDQLEDIEDLDAATKKLIKTITKYQEVVKEGASATETTTQTQSTLQQSIDQKIGTSEGSQALTDETIQQIVNLEKKTEELSKSIQVIENNIEGLSNFEQVFSTTTEQVNKLEEALKRVNLQLSDLRYFASSSDIAYHGGDLDHLSTTRKSESWTDRIDGLVNGGYGAWGTGTYITKDISDIQSGRDLYAIDLSKYNLYVNKTREDAENLNAFLSQLEKYVLASGNFRGFDEELSNVNVKSLYTKYQNTFKEIALDFSHFEAFIKEMQKLVGISGIDENGVYHLQDKSLEGSDSIPTRFMKSLGYQGINNSGIPEFDNVEHGSVIYDLDKLNPYIKKFADYNELLAYNQKLLTSVRSLSPIDGVDLTNLSQLTSLLSQIKNTGPAESQAILNLTNHGSVNMSEEAGSVIPLKTAVDDVTTSINKKTQAIRDEEAQLKESVSQELKSLVALKMGIDDVIDSINNLESKSNSISIDPSINPNSWNASIDDALKKIGKKTIPLEAQVDLDDDDKVTKAFKNLARTEYEWQSLDAKYKAETISDADLKKWIKLSQTRENDNLLIKQQTDLTEKQKKAQADLIKAQKVAQDELKKLQDRQSKEQETKKKNTASRTLDNEIKKQEAKYIKAAALENEKTAGYKQKLIEIRDVINQLKTYQGVNIVDTQDIQQIENLKLQLAQLFEEIKGKSFEPIDPEKVSQSVSAISALRQDFSKAVKSSRDARKEIEQLEEALKGATTEAERLAITKKLQSLRAELRATGKTGLTLIEQWKKRLGSLFTYLASFGSFYEILNLFRQGFTIIKELDDGLTEMRKVSDSSLKTLKEYQRTTFDLADSVGTTSSALQKSTADWMRLGEAMDEAKESALVTTKLLNVSEFGEIGEATEAMIAMSQAYKEMEKGEILDVLNNIGNNFAIGTDDLAQGLQKSASALKATGNDLYAATALMVGANQVTQDALQSGNALRTISLRIIGTEESKQELAALGEDVEDFVVQTQSKIDETVRKYTAVASNQFKGVSLLDNNGNYRSTYEILQDIADIYQEILQADKEAGTNRGSALIELLAGKNRANVLSSILESPQILREVYQTAQKSAGSADEELAKYLDSITGKVEKFKNQLQELASVTFDTEFIKDAIDLGTDLLSLLTDIVDKAGVLGLGATAGAGFGIFQFVKNLDYPELRGIKIA